MRSYEAFKEKFLRKVSQRNHHKAFSVLEMLIALSIFVIMVGSVSVFSMDSVAYIKNQEIMIEVNSQMNQLMDAVIDYKAIDWKGFASHEGEGQRYFSTEGGELSIAEGSNVKNGVTTYFTIEEIYRDDDYNIVESTEGLLDPHTKKITVFASWNDVWLNPQERTNITYVNNWEVQRWRSQNEDSWIQGAFHQTEVEEETQDVTLELLLDFQPNWCYPVLSTTYYDINGSGIPSSVIAQEGYAYFGTGQNMSGDSFTKGQITPVLYGEPEFEIIGIWNGEKANHVSPIVGTDYAVLATDHPNREVVILRHDSPPYAQTGTVNLPGPQTPQFVFVYGTVGYVASGRVIYSFNMTSYSGARSIYSNITVGGSSARISTMVAYGNYLFVGMETDTNEIYVVNVSNPSSMSVVNSFSVNSMNTRGLHVAVEGTRLFILTTLSDTEDELFLVDISDITGTYSVVNSIDVSTMQTTSLAVVEDDRVFIIAGNAISGQNNYKVYVWEDEEDIFECGGMTVTDDIIDIDSTRLFDELTQTYNYHTYSVVNNANREFQIVRGAQGIVGGWGYGYYREGTYTSEAYDSGSTSTDYHYFRWLETVPEETTTLKIQIRAATTVGGLTSATWVGPGDDPGTFYEDNEFALIPDSFDGKRYLQFKVYMTTTNQDITPRLHRIDVFYQE